MNMIAFMKDGKVRLKVFPSKRHRDRWRPKAETDEQFVARSIKRHGITDYIVNPELPKDRENRDKWVIRDGKVVVGE